MNPIYAIMHVPTNTLLRLEILYNSWVDCGTALTELIYELSIFTSDGVVWTTDDINNCLDVMNNSYPEGHSFEKPNCHWKATELRLVTLNEL